MTLNELLNSERMCDVYRLARYMYRIGEPIIEDVVYDRLEAWLKSSEEGSSVSEFFTRTYDDDPVPEDLLAEVGIRPVYAVPTQGRQELYRYLNEDKSKSIKAITEMKDAYPFFQFLREQHLDFIASLKTDGVNTKMLYLDDKFRLSLSRGRNGDSFDYTDNSAKVMPQSLNFGKPELRIWGESYVEDSAKQYLQQKYNKPYATAKSSAISMLRVPHELVDYKYLHTLVFSAPGLAKTQHETFEILRNAGLTTVPYLWLRWNDIPESYEEFKLWIAEILDMIHQKGEGIPSDGVVIEVDDLSYEPDVHGQYLSTQIALKFSHWSFQFYSGVITDIHVTQRRVYQAVTVSIEPMYTKDGCAARVINVFNPAQLINNGLNVGSRVYFEKNSGAVNIMLHGEKLARLLEGDEVDD
ncbi:hypothetical protein [Acetivibrio ethanolgignens]|uniref:NAD-dependent DNA ligase adenylation domain-containing protein n=1 Tax=Acetivibrio ethanolgignens TaxID=290052 RepID=A0A0V8QCX9_9FIRM|nr:hypothetical protein [Acetivibrio ethanolgignens]KSV58270.1 hypothetical protein ASU35_13485 [Acetivibrio ethanolgignens]